MEAGKNIFLLAYVCLPNKITYRFCAIEQLDILQSLISIYVMSFRFCAFFSQW